MLEHNVTGVLQEFKGSAVLKTDRGGCPRYTSQINLLWEAFQAAAIFDQEIFTEMDEKLSAIEKCNT